MTTRRPQDKNSSAMAFNANRNKNWRANYLHALNIFTPDLATRGRHVNDGRRTQNRRTDSRRASSDKSYVFGLRSHLFRARRLAPQSELVVDHVSAPIEIPTASKSEIPKVEKERDSEIYRRSDLHSNVQLLSWEEPAVMLGNDWSLESDKRNRQPQSIAEDTENEALTNIEDDDDDIFKMEFDDSNASSNVFRSKRHKDRPLDLRQRRPGGIHDFDEDDDVVTPLSASFVPPHQMVERGCFSLGLRDELKRKPGVHIQ